jgi:2-polyprenyl-3-methyl-5-hydroxy-6-metoxy-1,4-benzoquinol methylase
VPEDFQLSDRGLFDSLLLSHVLEHMDEDAGVSLISSYLRSLRPSGKIVVITPQAAGQRSDPTHVRLIGEHEVSRLFSRLGVEVESARSFPFPRPVGRFFTYNETVVTGVLRGEASRGD